MLNQTTTVQPSYWESFCDNIDRTRTICTNSSDKKTKITIKRYDDIKRCVRK